MPAIEIEVAVDDHALGQVSEVVAQVGPGYEVSVADLRHFLSAYPGERFYVARRGGEAVGSLTTAPAGRPGCLFTMARVLPRARRRGVGRALLRCAAGRAIELDQARLWGRVDVTDADALAFVEHVGLEETGREYVSSLDLTTATAMSVPPPAGIAITSLAEHPELTEGAYAADVVCVPDIPSPTPMTSTSFHEWVEQTLEGPGGLPGGVMVAVADGTVVGYAALRGQTGQPGRADHELTCVVPAWRSRGVATALKRAQIEWARSAGFTELTTSNDSPNVEMLAVNRKLGYRVVEERISVEIDARKVG
jgi:GNAT superfamily N-acetyltransferase